MIRADVVTLLQSCWEVVCTRWVVLTKIMGQRHLFKKQGFHSYYTLYASFIVTSLILHLQIISYAFLCSIINLSKVTFNILTFIWKAWNNFSSYIWMSRSWLAHFATLIWSLCHGRIMWGTGWNSYRKYS